MQLTSANTIEVLKKLDKKELKRFGEFLRNPYFNSTVKLNDLYREVIKNYPEFSDWKSNSRKISQKIYKGKKVSEGTINNLYSEFGKELRKFLAYEEISRDENTLNLNLVKALSGKELYDISNKIIDDMYEKIRRKTGGPEHYWYLFRLDELRSENLLNTKKLKVQHHYDAQYSTVHNLLSYFLCKFMDVSNAIAITFKTNKVESKDGNPKELINLFNRESLFNYLNSIDHPNSAAIKLYYLLHYFQVSECTKKDYYEIKKILVDNINNLSKRDLLNFWVNLEDLVILKLIPSDHKFYREIFELNNLMCTRKIFPDDTLDHFSVYLLRNIITVAFYLEKYEWAENFLNEYIDHIKPNLRENENYYHRGLFSFKFKKYGESLQYLSKVKFADIFENLNVRFYLLMNYIELRYYESALSTIKSIRQFYRSNNEIPEFLGGLINDSLKYFSEIIRSDETNTKLDYSVYKEASKPGRYYHKGYILNKMKRMI